MSARIEIDQEKIAEFCRRWKITELALFGSVLRDDFRPDSDVDVMVTFEPNSGTSLFDLVHMQDELKEIIGREVDLVTKTGLKPRVREHVLPRAEVLYAA